MQWFSRNDHFVLTGVWFIFIFSRSMTNLDKSPKSFSYSKFLMLSGSENPNLISNVLSESAPYSFPHWKVDDDNKNKEGTANSKSNPRMNSKN